MNNYWLKALAPWLGVLIGMYVCKNAWVAILLYHAQAVFWSRHEWANSFKGWDTRKFGLFALPCVFGGVLAYFLLPLMVPTELGEWLSSFGLNRISFALLIPYFGILHPPLEQAHWRPLRARKSAHLLFAGYHVLVLCTLLSPVWLACCFGILAGVSALWHWLDEQNASVIATLSHILADVGIVVAFEVMVEAGIQPESAYYESLHETPLIANTISRKKLFEMNRIISDTAEYGCYLFAHAAVPLLEEFMTTVETDVIGTGLELTDLAVDNQALVEVNREIRSHLVEEVGDYLRGAMEGMKAL